MTSPHGGTEPPVVDLVGDLDATGLRIGVVVSTFNETITDGLLAGALEVIRRAGAGAVVIVRVAGSFELPLVAERMATRGHDVVIALGAVILGETDHYEHVAHRASEGLARVALDTGVPVGFGVLTTRDASQAVERSRPGPANKGAEAAEAAIRAADALRKVDATSRELDAAMRQSSRRTATPG